MMMTMEIWWWCRYDDNDNVMIKLGNDIDDFDQTNYEINDEAEYHTILPPRGGLWQCPCAALWGRCCYCQVKSDNSIFPCLDMFSDAKYFSWKISVLPNTEQWQCCHFSVWLFCLFPAPVFTSFVQIYFLSNIGINIGLLAFFQRLLICFSYQYLLEIFDCYNILSTGVASVTFSGKYFTNQILGNWYLSVSTFSALVASWSLFVANTFLIKYWGINTWFFFSQYFQCWWRLGHFSLQIFSSKYWGVNI